jgi:endonuclease/exonuclease/phosphatase family metal-dependent hydrolase
MSKRIRILTYNIHKGYAAGNRRFVLEAMRGLIASTNADIVFLQEIHGRDSGLKRRDKRATYPEQPHFEFLADQSWPHHAYGQNAIYRKGDHGNAILSKYPFLRTENINVAWLKTASRSILHGVVQLPRRRQALHVLCVHLGLFEQERRDQIRILCERIESHIRHDEPIILAGDFNDWRRRAEKYLHAHLGLDELFYALQGKHARTWPIQKPLLAMDRIYYRGVRPLRCERLCEGEWRQLSDHAALLGEFDF